MTTRSNVDRQEIAKFEALAARWWDMDGEFRPLHEINPLRGNFIDGLSPVADRDLVDVGCGGGILAEAMARRGAAVTGIDMGEAPLSVARLHQLESGLDINYRQATAEELAAEQPGAYDVVCCLEMLEHVPDPGAVVAACAALARPGASLYFSTINRNPKAFLFAIVGAEHILRLLPAGTHEYDKFIKPSELAGWVRDAGLVLREMTGLTYSPLTKRYRLNDRDLSVNYMLRAEKPA
ncbi:bifunctional 2-polyprenyl-6-hydroxyphenol methylase/3-demethylubiquinol 3-O-methyltransferase UbiG [Pseudohaliea rubra]|uniref:Ubiquinone biosynthesis O-methyltransferase n=1 Tax=Pseudohaliea rubra DSM 19751 TaxID=1265313 RepID=A0A095VW96_9GAMM|nr:bifunctional 2-polyprenyl-6-hydroxyphenol methylase/3-demethylubiquinol 3-O-methyltransferase UbiG [Pseudohaliea rubra]KGE05338.1 3-demethylubiquinone-9 3-methyltransferase [Pseudohaliea rubra DSM 19751]